MKRLSLTILLLLSAAADAQTAMNTQLELNYRKTLGTQSEEDFNKSFGMERILGRWIHEESVTDDDCVDYVIKWTLDVQEPRAAQMVESVVFGEKKSTDDEYCETQYTDYTIIYQVTFDPAAFYKTLIDTTQDSKDELGTLESGIWEVFPKYLKLIQYPNTQLQSNIIFSKASS